MVPVITRILLRYLSGALVTYGLIPHEVGAELAVDPDVAFVLGTAVAAATEAFYAWAKARGAAT